MTPFPTALLAGLALVLAILAGPTAGVAQENLLATEQAQLNQLRSVRDELAVVADRQVQTNAALAERLDAFDPTDPGDPATLDSLRQVQFELNLAQTRLQTIDRRIEVSLANLRGIDTRLSRLDARIPQEGAGTLEELVEEALRALLREQRGVQTEILASLRRYRTVANEYLALVREQLALERERISLEGIIGLEDILVDPLVARLRLRVANLNQENIALSNEAAAIVGDTPETMRERNLLQLRADGALLASNARLVDIDIVVARRTLEALSELVGESAAPLDLLENARERLAATRRFLAGLEQEIERNAAALTDLAEISAAAAASASASGNGEDAVMGRDALERRLAQLRTLFEDQRREVAELQEKATPLAEDFARSTATRAAQALSEREAIRIDSVTRGRLADEAAELPAKMIAVIEDGAITVADRVEDAPPSRLLQAAAALVGVVVLFVFFRRVALPRLLESSATNFTVTPLRILRNKLFWLAPAAAFAAVAAILGVPGDVFRLALTLLLVPAVASFVRGILQETVISHSEGRRRRIGETIRSLTTASVVVIAAVLVAYTILGDTFVLPSTRSWINRLVFAAFIVAAIPLFLFALFFTARAREDRATAGQAALAGLSLVPPILLVGIGVVGLLGYTRLATELFADFATLAAVLLVLAFAIAVLHDLLEAGIARIRAKDPARAYFMRANFAKPLNRAGQILLALVALATIWDLFDLSTETPVVREIIAVLSQPLFTAGGTTYRIGSILAAVVALWAVFWIGGWSQRVSYTILYRRVRDLGIRQSLSVFTKYVVIVVGLLVTLSIIGFDVTTLTVFAASLGVGIGFGLQNVVNNFISGILILIERPLRIGDIVTVTGNTGTVDAIGIRSLRLRTFDEYDVIVPNSAVISDTFVNWSRTDKVIRQLVTVGISYGDDPVRAVEIVRGIVSDFTPPILATPPPSVTVDEFADSAVNIRVAYYIELGGSVGLFDIRDHVLTRIWHAFRDEGITIPFPQRDVHLISADGKPRSRTAGRAASEPTAEPDAGAREPETSPASDRDQRTGEEE